MKKDVIISIRGTQTDESGKSEVMEFVTQGNLMGNLEDGYHLTYQESELTGLEGTTTTFRIEKDRITMLRTGNMNSEMVFEEGKRHLSLYETPMGGLMIGVNTRYAKTDIGQDGGNLEVRYSVEIDNALIGENCFEIQVRNPGAQPQK